MKQGPEFQDDHDHDRDYEIPEEDFISEENVLAGIRANFNEIEMTKDTAAEIKNFLVNFGIKEAKFASDDEINILWQYLSKNPALIKDFTYLVTDVKTNMFYSEYPLAVHINDLVSYAQELDNPESIRPYLIKSTLPTMKSLGVSRVDYVSYAYADSERPNKAAEAMRFLGWVASQPFMRYLPAAKNEFMKRHEDEEKFSVFDLAAVAMMEVAKHRDMVAGRAKRYKGRNEQEIQAKETHDDVVLAMNAIYRRLSELFLNNGNPSK